MSDKDYKDSLCLPQTSFPMRAGLALKEPEILASWAELGLWKALREKSRGRPPFILHDGPPYANGHLHLGHALNKILKDAINRSFQMRGYDANYVPGWDCHGLPIEWKIEEHHRAQGLDKDAIPIVEFRRHCRDFAGKWVDIQRAEFQRLGIAGDWETPYLTMDFHAEAKIADEIGRFLFDESLYQGAKPVMWSVVEKTALAEAEIEYKDHRSTTIWVAFPIVETEEDALQDASVVIWTTTPWTIPGNRGLAFHESLSYVVFIPKDGSFAGRKLLVAASLLEDFTKQIKSDEGDIVAELKGVNFPQNIKCAHPLFNKGYDFTVPLKPAPFVTDDQGTGFVHIAPGHGREDYEFGLTHQLHTPETVNEEGVFVEKIPLFAGKTVYRNSDGKEGDANKAIIEALKAEGNLMAKGHIDHSYPHSWRSKAPLIFRSTRQWFISMEKADLRQKSLKAIDETRFVPASEQARLRDMVENRPDWCVSRQRAWGVPLPIFVEKKTGLPLRDKKVMERIVALFNKEGADSWFSHDMADFLGPDYKSEDFIRIDDVVDVWFDSGATHAFVLEDRDDLSWPASLYLEGTDQHRGWFHSSLLHSCGTRGRAPYQAILTHGFMLDEKGHKMSKSLGNIITPREITDQYGADILRLFILGTNYTDDIRIGHNIIARNVDIYRRIRNSFRWLLGNITAESPAETPPSAPPARLPLLEQLMLHRLAKLGSEVEKACDNFDMTHYLHLLYHFCNSDLSAFYFDIRKDRLYCDAVESEERQATLFVLEQIFAHLIRWFAPLLPFTTEEAFQAHYGLGKSVHLEDFLTPPVEWNRPELETLWEPALTLRRVALGALEVERKAGRIGSSLEAVLHIHTDAKLKQALEKEDFELDDLTLTSRLFLHAGETPEEAFRLDNIDNMAARVEKTSEEKCQRCWKILPEVVEGLCKRCHSVCDGL